MKHVLYSLFKEPAEADAALYEVKAGLSPGVCTFHVHRGGLTDNHLHHSEGESRQGVVIGLVMGLVVGGLLGWLLVGPMALLRLGTFHGVAFGAAMGIVMGGVGGWLYGAGLPDKQFQKMTDSLKEGQVLITTEVEGLSAEDKVEQIFRRHGAIEANKAMMV